MSDPVGGREAEIDFAGIVAEMAEAMPVMRSMNPEAEKAWRRNTAAQGLRALLDAGYVPVRSSGSAAQNQEECPICGKDFDHEGYCEVPARSPQDEDHEAP